MGDEVNIVENERLKLNVLLEEVQQLRQQVIKPPRQLAADPRKVYDELLRVPAFADLMNVYKVCPNQPKVFRKSSLDRLMADPLDIKYSRQRVLGDVILSRGNVPQVASKLVKPQRHRNPSTDSHRHSLDVRPTNGKLQQGGMNGAVPARSSSTFLTDLQPGKSNKFAREVVRRSALQSKVLERRTSVEKAQRRGSLPSLAPSITQKKQRSVSLLLPNKGATKGLVGSPRRNRIDELRRIRKSVTLVTNTNRRSAAVLPSSDRRTSAVVQPVRESRPVSTVVNSGKDQSKGSSLARSGTHESHLKHRPVVNVPSSSRRTTHTKQSTPASVNKVTTKPSFSDDVLNVSLIPSRVDSRGNGGGTGSGNGGTSALNASVDDTLKRVESLAQVGGGDLLAAQLALHTKRLSTQFASAQSHDALYRQLASGRADMTIVLETMKGSEVQVEDETELSDLMGRTFIRESRPSSDFASEATVVVSAYPRHLSSLEYAYEEEDSQQEGISDEEIADGFIHVQGTPQIVEERSMHGIRSLVETNRRLDALDEVVDAIIAPTALSGVEEHARENHISSSSGAIDKKPVSLDYADDFE